ncbi:MAG: methyl-accepting chemotaxis protein [bacterium]
MEHSHQKRKWFNLGIKRQFQLRILGWILLIVVISSLISGGIFYHYSNRQIDTTYKQFHVQLHNMRQVLIPWTLLAIGIGGFLALTVALFYPQKLAGPLYRLERRIQSIALGNLHEDFRLRSNDELQDLAREINQMGASLRERLLAARESSHYLDAMIQKDLPGACSEHMVRKLQTESARLKKIFEDFTL